MIRTESPLPCLLPGKRGPLWTFLTRKTRPLLTRLRGVAWLYLFFPPEITSPRSNLTCSLPLVRILACSSSQTARPPQPFKHRIDDPFDTVNHSRQTPMAPASPPAVKRLFLPKRHQRPQRPPGIMMDGTPQGDGISRATRLMPDALPVPKLPWAAWGEPVSMTHSRDLTVASRVGERLPLISPLDSW